MTSVKFPRRQFLQLAAGAAALPALPYVARAQAYPARVDIADFYQFLPVFIGTWQQRRRAERMRMLRNNYLQVMRPRA